jgi:uncharacterized protein (DUF4415 family)
VKSAKNERDRGLPFELAVELEWHKAHAFVDGRRDYGEERIIALAPMRGGSTSSATSSGARSAESSVSARQTNERSEPMKRRPLTDESGEVRELTKADLSTLKPMAEIDPGMIEAAKNRGGRPKAETPKVHIGFRMASDLVQAIKATGKGYNARVEKVLRDAYKRGKL